jgi:hypothetical protein
VKAMGPNSKKRSRSQYVKYRLKVLKELCIAPPSDAVIERLNDESQTTETQVDAVFLQCILNARK